MRATAVHAARKSSNPKPVETWLRTFRQTYSRIIRRNREQKNSLCSREPAMARLVHAVHGVGLGVGHKLGVAADRRFEPWHPTTGPPLVSCGYVTLDD